MKSQLTQECEAAESNLQNSSRDALTACLWGRSSDGQTGVSSGGCVVRSSRFQPALFFFAPGSGRGRPAGTRDRRGYGRKGSGDGEQSMGDGDGAGGTRCSCCREVWITGARRKSAAPMRARAPASRHSPHRSVYFRDQHPASHSMEYWNECHFSPVKSFPGLDSRGARWGHSRDCGHNEQRRMAENGAGTSSIQCAALH